MNFETEKLKFKAQFTEAIYKEVIAFANMGGGVTYVGIDKNGNAVELTDVDQEYSRITNFISSFVILIHVLPKKDWRASGPNA